MKPIIYLWLILLLAAFLRLYSLSSVPNGLTWDEAAIGYNAYSILKTGRDEHGAFLPLIFKSFGDFKPGFYIYLTVPSVAIFGLNEFAVRFPSAVAGVLAVLGVYLLVNKLVPSKSNFTGLFASLSLALSPWHVHFSHGAWEVNLFTTLLLFAIYYFYLFIKKHSTLWPFLILSSLTLVVYQAAKLLTPLIFLGLVIIYKKRFFTELKPYLTSKKILYLIPFIIFGAWIMYGMFFSQAGNRLATLSVLNYRPELANTYYENQPLLSFSLIISRYLYHFTPEVLFYEGTKTVERAHIPGLGLLHPLEFVWIFFGLAFLSKIKKTSSKVILFLLLISPVPASLTLAEFSPVRALFMVLPLSIISGLGLFMAFKKLPKIIFLGVVLFYAFVSVYVFDLYFVHSQKTFATEFNYGYKQVVQIIKDNPTSKVVFTDVYGQPYIYYLFYTEYDPKIYQQTSHFISGGLDVGRVFEVANVKFHQFGGGELDNEKDTLFIGTEGNISKSYDITGDNIIFFKQIETPDKQIIFRVVKTRGL